MLLEKPQNSQFALCYDERPESLLSASADGSLSHIVNAVVKLDGKSPHFSCDFSEPG